MFLFASSLFISSIFFISSSLFLISFSSFLILSFIICIISSIEILLSSNEETDIFKSVMSVFKLSIFSWFPLFCSANSLIFSTSSALFWLISLIFSSILLFSSLFLLICSTKDFFSFSNFSLFEISFSISFSIALYFSFIPANFICDSWDFLFNSSINLIIFSFSLIYFSFAVTISSICLSNFLISSARLFISAFLPNMFTVFFCTDPPVIAPDGFITSPSSVTILKAYLLFLAIFIAVWTLSVITVLPNKFCIIFSYFLSYFTRFDASAITPFSFFILLAPYNFPSSSIIFSNTLPFIDEIGKNDARPKLFLRKSSIMFLASFSFSVTMFWMLAPKHISIATWYLGSVEIMFASTPQIPLLNSGFFSHTFIISLTDLIYPSFSLSVSNKKLCLETFILFSSTRFWIFVSYSEFFIWISFDFSCIFSNSVKSDLACVSISFFSFVISFLIFLLSSIFDMTLCNSLSIWSILLFEFSTADAHTVISFCKLYFSSTSFSFSFLFSSFFISLSDNFFVISSSSFSFSFSSFSNFSLLFFNFSFFNSLFSFSSFNSSIFFLVSSISALYFSLLSSLFLILAIFTLISEFIFSIWFLLSNLEFCISSIFLSILSISSFKLFFNCCKLFNFAFSSIFWFSKIFLTFSASSIFDL